MDYIEKQIRELESEEIRLAEKKKNLHERKKLYDSLDEKLEKFFSESEFTSPIELAQALIDKYGIKLSERRNEGRRKRTTITAELRDKVKAYVRAGQSMNSVSKELNISYAVVVKIMKGAYDHLISRAELERATKAA